MTYFHVNQCTSDTKVSMLFRLLLANIRIYRAFSFSFFLVMLSNFFIIPVIKEKVRVKIAPAIPTGPSTTFKEEMIKSPPLVALKTIKTLSM